MSSSRIKYLLGVYNRRAATPEEEQELMALLGEPANEHLAKEWINSVIEDKDTGQAMPPEHAAHILEAIFQVTEKQPPVKIRGLRRSLWWTAAAVLAGALAVSAYFLIQRPAAENSIITRAADVPPGKSQAVLVLADGNAVNLDSGGNRTLQQGNAAVRQANGQLQYALQGTVNAQPAYNELRTPRGGHFRLQLSDGTTVWLNAGSSLKYPTAFTSHERAVELTGEAYFEVTKDASKPFLVTAGNMKVQVLGTHFNIKAYGDEGTVNTTLLQGSVKVSGNNGSSLLKPGEQARMETNGRLSVISVNAGDAIAWKNGIFMFKSADIRAVMREISRWYNVDVKYEGQLTAREFAGKISRNYTLQEVLAVLEASDVHFRLEGKELTVIP